MGDDNNVDDKDDDDDDNDNDADNFRTVTERGDRIADLLGLRARYAPTTFLSRFSRILRECRAHTTTAPCRARLANLGYL